MSDWISVEDRLPKKYNHVRTKSVLLWCNGQPNMPIIIGYGVMDDGVNYPFTVNRWFSHDTGYNGIYGDVTHWQPLPEPPQ